MENKTKTSLLSSIAVSLSFVTLIIVFIYLGCYSVYNDSLRTNDISGNLAEISLYAWLLFSFLSVIISFIAIIWSAIQRKLRDIGIAVLAIFITLFAAGMVMPTMGLACSTIYTRKANAIALKALNEFNQTSQSRELGGPFLLTDYQIEYVEPNNDDEPQLVEVFYELKREVEFDSFPQHFSVTLNLENAKTKLQKEGKRIRDK